MRLIVEGRPGWQYSLPIRHGETIVDIKGAEKSDDLFKLFIPDAATDDFSQHEITLTLE